MSGGRETAYHTVVNGVERWVDDVPSNATSHQLQIVLTPKRSAEFRVIKLLAP